MDRMGDEGGPLRRRHSGKGRAVPERRPSILISSVGPFRPFPPNKPATEATRVADSNAQCEQCNHTHTDSQHCECYRIVVQPMQPLLHGTPPLFRIILVSEKAAETTSSAALGSAVHKGRHPSGSVRLRGTKTATGRKGLWRACALRTRRFSFSLGGTGRQALSFWVMNRFRSNMTHITIAVALIGATVTIGLAVWHSQKGKTQGPAIIDNQHVSQGQR
jgi:hypothetical protein